MITSMARRRVWEEGCLVHPEPKWRNQMVAAAMFNLPGAKTADSPLMIRAPPKIHSPR